MAESEEELKSLLMKVKEESEKVDLTQHSENKDHGIQSHHFMANERKKESEVTQSCATLCDPMDCSLPGSPVPGIFQARVLEWVSISFSRGSSQPRDWTQVSCIAGRRFTLWATREAFMANRWGNNGNSETLFYLAPKSLQMVIEAMKLKDACSLEENLPT